MNQESARSVKSANTGTRVKSISFAKLPHQSGLFLEYLSGSAAATKYYPNVTDSPPDIGKFGREVLKRYETDRGELCDALLQINRGFGAGTKTFENIELLRGDDCVAIVTGQQAGIFTGPLYTIYKALSAIKLADELRNKGTKAVPVFWIATEDHDFAEVAEVWLSSKNGETERLQYRPVTFAEGASVGDIRLDASIARFVDEMLSHLPPSAFTDEIRELLHGAYCEGSNLGEAFGKTLAALLAEHGLVFIDPLDESIKQLAAPIYAEAIVRVDEIVSAIQDRGKDLAADGFHSQVLVEDDYFPLFWHDDEGRRLALRRMNGGAYRVKGAGREFTKDELKSLALHDPKRFSPGVMLRAVVQDYLLPTLCYFGGSAEVAYFAQNGAAYEVLDRPVTPIFHRQSFTLVESRQRRALERFGWTLTDLFVGKDKAVMLAAEKVLSPDLAGLFSEVEGEINSDLDRLEARLSSTDPTLAKNLAKRRRKIIYHITNLRNKALISEVRKDATMRQQIDDLFNLLLPDGGLQERTLNVFSFLNKHGFGVIDLLYDCADVNDKDHWIIYF